MFPFIKFPGVDTILGPEMRSTGEVMGVGETFAEAFFKAQLGAGERIPKVGKVFMSVVDQDKPALLEIAKRFQEQGYGLCATFGTAKSLRENGIAVQIVNKVCEGRPNIVDAIKNNEIAIVVNTVNGEPEVIADSHSIRRTALQQRIPIYTTIAAARAIAESVKHIQCFDVYSVQQLHSQA